MLGAARAVRLSSACFARLKCLCQCIGPSAVLVDLCLLKENRSPFSSCCCGCLLLGFLYISGHCINSSGVRLLKVYMTTDVSERLCSQLTTNKMKPLT